jgi:hypothetical protein
VSEHRPVAPERSMSAWSMWLPPAAMACTRVSTLRPGGPADPSRQVDRGVDQAFEPEPDDQRGHQQQPGIGHQIGLVEGHLDAVDSARYWRHRKCLLVLVMNSDFDTAIFPGREALSADARLSTQVVHRCIEA